MSRGKVVEVTNISDDPNNSFDIAATDIVEYADKAVASWHTHPGADSNLSMGDMETFLEWPNMVHYIVGTDGISKFVVQDGDVIIG